MYRISDWFFSALGFLLCAPLLLAIALSDRFEKKRKIIPASPGLRPEDSERPTIPAGYMESMRTRELRAAFVARHATPEEILAAKNAKALRALMQNVGRN